MSRLVRALVGTTLLIAAGVNLSSVHGQADPTIAGTRAAALSAPADDIKWP